jgi:dihydroorotase
VLARESWQIPERLPFGTETIVPLAGGETLSWRLAA